LCQAQEDANIFAALDFAGDATLGGENTAQDIADAGLLKRDLSEIKVQVDRWDLVTTKFLMNIVEFNDILNWGAGGGQAAGTGGEVDMVTQREILQTGLFAHLWGADIIVNTDADYQYDQKQIPLLLKPIFDKKAEIVLGSRFKGTIEQMSFQKRIGNQIASKVLSIITGKKISDGQTGFRAFSRDAALKMNIFSNYTYTQETILQAVEKKIVISEVPIYFRKRAGKSRLISSIFSYAWNSLKTIFIYYVYYKPLSLFLSSGLLLVLLGLIAGFRVLIHFINTGLVSPYIPTTLLSSVLLVVGFELIVIGIVAEMIKHSREKQEEILYLLRK